MNEKRKQQQKPTNQPNQLKHVASAEPYSYNFPTNISCVNWNQYYTNCSQLGGNPFQSTISFDNIGMVSQHSSYEFIHSTLKRNENDNQNLMKIALLSL